jgi:hypothetical protein
LYGRSLLRPTAIAKHTSYDSWRGADNRCNQPEDYSMFRTQRQLSLRRYATVARCVAAISAINAALLAVPYGLFGVVPYYLTGVSEYVRQGGFECDVGYGYPYGYVSSLVLSILEFFGRWMIPFYVVMVIVVLIVFWNYTTVLERAGWVFLVIASCSVLSFLLPSSYNDSISLWLSCD